MRRSFSTLIKHEKIFSKSKSSRPDFPLPASFKVNSAATSPAAKNYWSRSEKDVFQKADDLLLTTYSPPAVLVNKNGDILHFRGDTSPWLSLAPGKANLNILKMAISDISFEVRAILQQVREQNTLVQSDPIKTTLSGKDRLTILEATPVEDGESACYLLLFISKEILPSATSASQGATDQSDSAHQERIEQLERELANYREQMRVITEDYETTNEELHTANEELLTGSEELQSVNEELESSKEELQSTNEELITINRKLTDSNEQLRNSQKFRDDVFVTLREAILILDQNFKITTATDGFMRKFLSEEANVIGLSLLEISNGEWNLEKLRENIGNMFSTTPYFENIEVEQHTLSGSVRRLLVNGRRLERIDGKPLFMIAIEDISDQRAKEQALYEIKKTNVALENSNMELEQFAAVASHDLQEPLRKIITFTNIIVESNMQVSENAKSYINKIAASADRMQSLIVQLLNYSKISGSERVIEPIDLNKILLEVVTDFEVAIQQSNAEIIIDELPVIKGNALYINQLFYNLINNALKFQQKNHPPIIQIRSRSLSPEEIAEHYELDQTIPYSDITVTDNGIGFEQKFSTHIFKLFQRLNSTQKYPGTGIGLALCRKIAIEHGGKIDVESQEGQGTTFHVILPLQTN